MESLKRSCPFWSRVKATSDEALLQLSAFRHCCLWKKAEHWESAARKLQSLILERAARLTELVISDRAVVCQFLSIQFSPSELFMHR